jgi:peptidoglycan/xylan/chitin deacetylase (PgdA/CDA1 family)
MHFRRQLVKSLMTATLPRSLFLVNGPVGPPMRSVAARPTSDGGNIGNCEVALTFDDGPHPEQTPRLLDLLAAHQMRATFFLIGRKAAQYPSLVRRIVSEGHELGNHTYTHSEPKETSHDQFQAEIDSTRLLLEGISGKTCRLVRPPKGKLTLRKAIAVWKQRQTIVLWNVDPRDYRMQSDDEMQAWCRDYHPSAGDIVLMHDTYPFASNMLDSVAARWVSSGVKTVCVSHWLRRRLAMSTMEFGDSNVGEAPCREKRLPSANAETEIGL